jgi:hypothetical protein
MHFDFAKRQCRHLVGFPELAGAGAAQPSASNVRAGALTLADYKTLRTDHVTGLWRPLEKRTSRQRRALFGRTVERLRRILGGGEAGHDLRRILGTAESNAAFALVRIHRNRAMFAWKRQSGRP